MVAEKLDQRFRILTGGNRTALRHQTMRALIDWSYDLLSPAEKQLFESLSVFAGGCTLATATAVADDGAEELDVLDLLSSLVDTSLVVADVDAPEVRYRLLESSREYAREKLAAHGRADLVARRHAAAYTKLAEQLEHAWETASDAAWCENAKRMRLAALI